MISLERDIEKEETINTYNMSEELMDLKPIVEKKCVFKKLAVQLLDYRKEPVFIRDQK